MTSPEPRIDVVRTGPEGASPLVLLHGLGADHRMWRPQIDLLALRYDVLAWDSRGHGSSDWVSPATLDTWVGDLDRVLDTHGVEAATLIGLSMGGIQAMAFALDRPERVRSVVLANTWAGLAPEDLERKLTNLPRRATEVGLVDFADEYTRAAFGDPDSAGATDYRDALSRMPLPAYVESAESCFGAQLEHRIHDISVPTLVLWGERDSRMPRPLSERITELIPNSRLTVVPDAGHLSNLDNPAAFTGAVQEFLEETEVAVPSSGA